jgi:hypothetical protein
MLFLFSFFFHFFKEVLDFFLTVPSISSSVFTSGFFFAGCFHFSLVVSPTGKIALESLWRMVAVVNWEGCHHRDCWSSVHLNCRMVVAEKVNEQVVTMTTPKTIVEAREKVLTMAAPAPGGLSEIHHSRGL